MSLSVTGFSWQVGIAYRWRNAPQLTVGGRPVPIFDTVRNAALAYPRLSWVREGGLSDLVLDTTDATGSSFWSVSDRGAVLGYSGDAKVFPVPAYHQKIFRLRVEDDSLLSLSVDSLVTSAGKFTTGLPSPLGNVGETAYAMPRLDSAQSPALGADSLQSDSAGFDFEGITPDGAGGFYLSDEMGPWIAHVAAGSTSGVRTLDTVYRPSRELPAVLLRRNSNKGMEGLARLPAGALVGVLQAPLENAVKKKRRSHMADSSRVHRMVVYRPSNGSVSEYVYLNDVMGGTRDIANISLGACAAVDDHRVIVVEHGKASSGYRIDLWLVDLDSATDIHRASDLDTTGLLVRSATVEEVGIDSALLVQYVRPVKKTLLLSDLLSSTPWKSHKVEGLALVDDSTVAIAADNDFGVQVLDDDGIPHALDSAEAYPALMYLRVPSLGLSPASGISGVRASRTGPQILSKASGWMLRWETAGERTLSWHSLDGRILRRDQLSGSQGFLASSDLPEGLLVLSDGSGWSVLLSHTH